MLGHKGAGYIESHGYKAVKTFNPYWDKQGKTFEDQTDIESRCRTRPGLCDKNVPYGSKVVVHGNKKFICS